MNKPISLEDEVIRKSTFEDVFIDKYHRLCINKNFDTDELSKTITGKYTR